MKHRRRKHYTRGGRYRKPLYVHLMPRIDHNGLPVFLFQGRCNREKPPCKYFHPPQHLKDQLLINGRNHLALKNALMQQMGLTPAQPLVPGQVPTVVRHELYTYVIVAPTSSAVHTIHTIFFYYDREILIFVCFSRRLPLDITLS